MTYRSPTPIGLERCTAHRKNGNRCGAFPIRGATVCGAHGGRAPQVKLKAEQRLALMVDPVLSELYRIALQGESDGVRLSAGRDLLDRAGLKPTERVQTDQEVVITVRRVELPIHELDGRTHD
jgi:hypothetical protein